MFFILSKVLQYLLAPLVWIFILIISSFMFKNRIVKKRLILTAFLILILFSNSFIQDEFMRAWELDAVKTSNIARKHDYGIVLTGMLTYDNKFERINFLRSTDRILQALDLYKQGIIEKIFITGGSGEVLNQQNKEALILKDYLIRIGIPEKDILIESNSRNTYENAVETAKILQPANNFESYLLITSAFHMRRASACFKKQGFEFDIFVTDRYAGNRKYTLDHIIIPKPGTLSRWTLLIHEISGFIVYKIMGYA
jgi:uncharacterized SAM-binding protein YcdF (DUF218 family)